MKNDDRILISADKTGNHYWTDKDSYKRHLHNNITKDYKKADEDIINNIRKGDKEVAERLEVDDRLYCTSKRDCFITLKDHKKQFMNNPKFRLINPAKPEIGMVSKRMLSKIISAIKSKSQLLQWKNSYTI